MMIVNRMIHKPIFSTWNTLLKKIKMAFIMNPSSVATGPIMNVLVLVINMLFLLDVTAVPAPLAPQLRYS